MVRLWTLLLSVVVVWTSQVAWPAVKGVEGARLEDVQAMQGTLYHVQGIALDKEHIWVTSVDTEHKRGYVHQFNRATHKFERQVDVTQGKDFHPGGLSVSGDSLWVPVAKYRPNSSAVLLELDKRTLAVKRRISVKDHLGCVAVTPDGLVAGNWGSRRFYVFDHEGRQTRVIKNHSLNQYQDLKFAGGMLVASGKLTWKTGSVDWYAWPSMKKVRSLRAGVTDHGRLYTEEGMAIEGKDLYLLPEDGPSRLFHFVLAEGAR
ncbi:DUF6454 family protein [Edaphobacter aggregans]|uniref:DUF6454 family protein n=1 Tax=Edaphobacter aggregans TaxID=570835 RepID=UPI0012FB9453|nr:DUF6454 family protein [Edaphobacter aggregans]